MSPLCALVLLSLSALRSNSYCVGSDALVFPDAVAYCEEVSSQLASFGNITEFNQILNLCNSTSSRSKCWIGLEVVGFTSDGPIYAFLDGSSLQYGFDANNTPTLGQRPWGNGQPSTITFPSNPQGCMRLAWDFGYLMDDAPCTTPAGFARSLPICHNGTISKLILCQ